MKKDRLHLLLIRVRIPETPLALRARAYTSKLWRKRLRQQNKQHLKPCGIFVTGSEKELYAGCVYGK